MSGIGWTEIAIVVVLIVILILGPKKLPELGSALGRSITGFKKGLKETKDEVQAAVKEDVANTSSSTTTTGDGSNSGKQD
ncbi:MAG: twin-arginine translocase TatA/TatE family subunit [Thermoleophilia bacterium]|nr:twin-arginine translocase TatA/TatE family subunit [Thermoleophilia bacterium]